MLSNKKYMSRDYLNENPSWDIEDSPWKADFVTKILKSYNIKPASICDVGCGSGGVLAELRSAFPQAELFGYDIAPDAAQFWPQHEALNIKFHIGDFIILNSQKYDVLLVLDVVEHVNDPFFFLSDLRGSSMYYLFHFPLDLSAINVIRETPILKVREKVGHIHYFTKNIALSLLKECRYAVIDYWYSGATFSALRRTWKTRIASLLRRAAYALNKDLGTRMFGGETLFVLARGNECEKD